MSPRSSRKTVSDTPAGDAPMDVYTGLMFVAFVALVTGCVLLVLELSKYGWEAAA